jgi:hypothetical protein
MTETYSKIGLVRIGWVGLNLQLAKLIVHSDELSLVTFWQGTYSFRPEDVLAIELLDGVISGMVRIRHVVENYPERVLFWSGVDGDKIRRAIRNSGFVAKADGRP